MTRILKVTFKRKGWHEILLNIKFYMDVSMYVFNMYLLIYVSIYVYTIYIYIYMCVFIHVKYVNVAR